VGNDADEKLFEYARTHDAVFGIENAREAGLNKHEIRYRREQQSR
jgi:hypothetical protein